MRRYVKQYFGARRIIAVKQDGKQFREANVRKFETPWKASVKLSGLNGVAGVFDQPALKEPEKPATNLRVSNYGVIRRARL